MKSRAEILQDVVRKYQEAGNSLPASPKEIARWAIENRFWAPRPEAIVNQCAEQISQAMSMEYFTDADGNRVRAKHAVVYPEGSHQHVIWDDMRTGDVRNLEVSLKQRRIHILHGCKQLKNDVDYFNSHRVPDKPIQMIFNFELDLEEMELARQKLRKRAA